MNAWEAPAVPFHSLPHSVPVPPRKAQADDDPLTNAWNGAAFSLEPILTQSAWFRTHNRDDVIDNLYFVGAGTHPGAGIPGVVGSAKATASLMV